MERAQKKKKEKGKRFSDMRSADTAEKRDGIEKEREREKGILTASGQYAIRATLVSELRRLRFSWFLVDVGVSVERDFMREAVSSGYQPVEVRDRKQDACVDARGYTQQACSPTEPTQSAVRRGSARARAREKEHNERKNTYEFDRHRLRIEQVRPYA